VVELRDKLAKLGAAPAGEQAVPPSISQSQEDVISALVNLGYAKPAAERAVETVVSNSKAEPAFEDLLRTALRQLSR
jgi:Holliday junction DNA helicase RuvA